MSEYTLDQIKKYVDRNGSISNEKIRQIEWEAQACHNAALSLEASQKLKKEQESKNE